MCIFCLPWWLPLVGILVIYGGAVVAGIAAGTEKEK